MHRLRIPDELGPVEHYKRQFDLFKDIAETIIQRLHSDYESWEVDVRDIENNTFRFSYWGLEFIVKAETTFCKGDEIFNEGEINTYLLIRDNQELIISYRFDSRGNINKAYLANQFAAPYFVDFVDTILELSSSGRVKLQL